MAFPFRKVTKNFFAFYKSFTYSATCSIFIIKILYHSSRKKVPLIAVRSSRTSYRFHSLHFSCSRNCSFQKDSSLILSFRCTPFRSIRSFVRRLFAFTSKLARRPLFGQSKEQSICHTFRFVHLPVSAGEPIVAVSTLFVEAAKGLSRAVNWS